MRKVVVILACALTVSLVTASWLWRELRELRAENAQLTTQLSAAAGIPAKLPASVTPAPDGSGQYTKPKVALKAEVNATHAGTEAEEFFEQQRRLLQNPKYRDAWKAEYRLNYTPRRENAIRLLGFTPAQADGWIELQIERDISRAEAAAAGPTGEPLKSREELFVEADRLYEEQVQALVGDLKYEKLQRYMESRPSRVKVDRFRNQLGEADTLRDDQVEPLIAVLHAEDAKMIEELNQVVDALPWESRTVESQRRHGERYVEIMSGAHGRVHAAASAILSRSQLLTLDAMLKRELESAIQQQEMAALQAGPVNPAD